MNRDSDSSSDDKSSQVLFTRDEVLGGLPARRAHALLFLIESRTAHLVAQSRQAAEILMTENTFREQELAFLEAFNLGREPPLHPTIQDLERQVTHWMYLVPDNPQLKATLAYLLAEKYRFTQRSVPGIRSALGLDEEVVKQSYQRLYRKPLETIFVNQPSLPERLRWNATAFARWIESLPPFWSSSILSFTISLPQALLSIPIVAAGVGPLMALAVVLGIGVINILTIMGFAEAVARSRSMRYGSAFFGRLVNEFLGSLGANILSVWFAFFAMLFVIAGYIGLSLTLQSFTGVSMLVWPVLLFIVIMYLLSRKLSFALTTMMALGSGIAGLIVIIAILSITHWRPENFLQSGLSLPANQPLVMAIGGSLSVALSAYCGHAFVIQISRVVTPRDESGRSIILGSAMGIAGTALLSAGWVLVVNGAVAPQALLDQKGTVLASLATSVGLGVNVLGAILVVMMLGLGTFRSSSLAFSLVKERLPRPTLPVLALPRLKGRLLICSRDRSGVCISVNYLGIQDNQPRFRLDVQAGENFRSIERAVAGTWSSVEMEKQIPELSQKKATLALEVLDADNEHVRLAVISSLAIKYEGEWVAPGASLADVLDLPDDLRRVVNWMTRRGEVGFGEIVDYINKGETEARATLESLVQKGFIREERISNEIRYRARYSTMRKSHLSDDIWQSLDQKIEESRKQSKSGWQMVRGPIGRIGGKIPAGLRNFLLSSSPVIAAFLIAEWLLLTEAQSFTGMLKLVGLLTVSLIFGIFPLLLIASTRRRGDAVPRVFYRFVGHPLVVGIIYLLFLGNFFLHGLVIWEGGIARTVAVLTGLLVVGITVATIRNGAFVPRLTLEFCQDARRGNQCSFAVVRGGQPENADAILGYEGKEQHYQGSTGEVLYPDSLRYAVFQLPSGRGRELKVWAYRITAEGNTESLPAELQTDCDAGNKCYDLKLFGGQVVLPITGRACQVKLTFESNKELSHKI